MSSTKTVPSVTVIMPAYNDVSNIRGAYESAIRALRAAGIFDYEILLMTVVSPDKSHDGTPDIAASIAQEDPNARHFPTPFFAGLGFKYREGIHAATKDYIIMVPSHNLTEESSLVNIMLHIGQADAIFTYTQNPESRPEKVHAVSKAYVTLCNILFGLNAQYYNGISVIRRDLLLGFPLSADDHSFMAEILVYAMKSGIRYIELPQVLKANTRTGRAWNVEGAFKVLGTISALFWKIIIKDEHAPFAPSNSVQLQPTLPEPNGPPNLSAVYQFFNASAIQTLHKTLVYMVKSVARSLESHLTSDNTGMFGLKEVFKILNVVSSLATTVTSKMAMVESSTPPVTRIGALKSSGDRSLTVIMPAYNEAERLPGAYESVVRAAKRAGISDFEVIFATITAPDGTHDGTPEVAKNIAEKDSRVRVLHSNGYYGLGYKYREAIREAKKGSVMVIAGDGEFEENSVAELLAYVGKSDLIIPYIANPEVRTEERRAVSQTFVLSCNTAFGLNIKYYNGPCIIRTDYVRAVPMRCDNYAYAAEILAYLIKSGAHYIEVPWKIKPSKNSKAFNIDSVFQALETIVSLTWKIRVDGDKIQLPVKEPVTEKKYHRSWFSRFFNFLTGQSRRPV